LNTIEQKQTKETKDFVESLNLKTGCGQIKFRSTTSNRIDQDCKLPIEDFQLSISNGLSEGFPLVMWQNLKR